MLPEHADERPPERKIGIEDDEPRCGHPSRNRANTASSTLPPDAMTATGPGRDDSGRRAARRRMRHPMARPGGPASTCRCRTAAPISASLTCTACAHRVVEYLERQAPDARRNEPVGDAGGSIERHRCAGAERRRRLRSTLGLHGDEVHLGAGRRRWRPRHRRAGRRRPPAPAGRAPRATPRGSRG